MHTYTTPGWGTATGIISTVTTAMHEAPRCAIAARYISTVSEAWLQRQAIQNPQRTQLQVGTASNWICATGWRYIPPELIVFKTWWVAFRVQTCTARWLLCWSTIKFRESRLFLVTDTQQALTIYRYNTVNWKIFELKLFDKKKFRVKKFRNCTGRQGKI